MIFLFPNRLLAQEKRTLTLKTNPVISLVSMWNIQADISTDEKRSFQLSFLSINDSYIFVDTEATGTIYSFDYKMYFRRGKSTALYVSPFVRYQHMLYEGNQDRVQLHKPGAGAMIGKEWLLFQRIVIDLHGGINYFSENYKIISTDGPIDVVIPKTLRGLGPRLGLLVGFRF